MAMHGFNVSGGLTHKSVYYIITDKKNLGLFFVKLHDFEKYVIKLCLVNLFFGIYDVISDYGVFKHAKFGLKQSNMTYC